MSTHTPVLVRETIEALAVQPEFRSGLKEGVVLTPGAEKCIDVYPLSEWKKLADTLTGLVTSNKMRQLNRAVFSLSIDGQGRIVLPPPLRQYAGIKDEVVITGVNNYLELWNKEGGEVEKAVSQEQKWQIIESLERH